MASRAIDPPLTVPEALTPKKHSKKRRAAPEGARTKATSSRRAAAEVRARWVDSEQGWELVHPRCALERAEDIEEVDQMVELGEAEIAIDELRWLLAGCSDFIAAHARLGELAMAENDLALARGHFGQAYRAGEQAMRRAGSAGPLPFRLPANQEFHSAGKGLIACLLAVGKREMAEQVVDQLSRLDPSDPLGVRELLDPRAPGDSATCVMPPA
jgi:hypothetical protein